MVSNPVHLFRWPCIMSLRNCVLYTELSFCVCQTCLEMKCLWVEELRLWLHCHRQRWLWMTWESSNELWIDDDMEGGSHGCLKLFFQNFLGNIWKNLINGREIVTCLIQVWNSSSQCVLCGSGRIYDHFSGRPWICFCNDCFEVWCFVKNNRGTL